MAANLVAGTGLHSVRVFFSRQIPSVLPTSHLLPYPNSPNICFEQSAYSLLPERYLFRGLKTWQKLGYTFTGKEKKKKNSKTLLWVTDTSKKHGFNRQKEILPCSLFQN